MHKIIHSEFEIDLSSHKITITEENHWFSDQFFTKYSFPFRIQLKEDLKDFFEYINSHNAIDVNYSLLVWYVNGNNLHQAMLEIDEIYDDIKVTLRYGLEEFPNFDKKLAELPLESLSVADIYAHASTIIPQTWPAVNYNFPQIFTDVIDKTDPLWQHFEGIINNYKNGAFVINEVITDTTYNRNIMQAVPYKLHILTMGFSDKGYTLKGDVVSNETLKKEVLFTEAEFYKKNDLVSVNLNVMGDEEISQSGNGADYEKTVTIPEKGKYRITGSIQLYSRWKKYVWVKLLYRDKILWTKIKKINNHHSGYLKYYSIDLVFETINDANPDEIKFVSSQFYRETNMLCDIYIDSETLYDAQGQGIPNITNPNKVDLTKVVPDMTFGQLVTDIKNKYNLDIEFIGNEVWMNHIEKNINFSNAFDLQQFEVRLPVRKPNKDISFLLKYTDIDSEDYSFIPIYFDYEGMSSDNFTKQNDTKEIILKIIPLPIVQREGIQTAVSFDEDKSKGFSLLYDGLTNGLNLAKDNKELLVPELVEKYYRKWFEFRVNSTNYKWSFIMWEEMLRDIKVKGKVYAYKNYHIIKQLQKRELKPDLYEVDIEVESILK